MLGQVRLESPCDQDDADARDPHGDEAQKERHRRELDQVRPDAATDENRQRPADQPRCEGRCDGHDAVVQVGRLIDGGRYSQNRIAGPASGPSVRKLLHANATAPKRQRSEDRDRVWLKAITS